MRCAAWADATRWPRRRRSTIEGEGVNFNLGQDMKPEAATQQFAISNYKRQIDIANSRQRVEQTRTPKFAFFQGPQPQTQILGLDGAGRLQRQSAGPGRRALGALAETDRRHDLYHHPLKLLRATLDPKTTVVERPQRRRGAAGRHHHRGRSGGDDDDQRGGRAVVDLVEGLSPEPRRRRDDDDVWRLPGRERPATAGAVRGKVDDFTTWEIRATRQTLDGEVGDLGAPAAVAAQAGRTAAAQRDRRADRQRASGSSPAAAITASSSSSRIT